MHIINITVRNKVAVNPAQDRYVCGNSDYIVRFDFDAEWDAFETKTARFIKEDGTPYDVVFSGNECPVPVISDTYKLQVGVFAGNLSTTTAAYVPCKKSILCGGGVPADPAPDVYNQIMAKVNEVGNAAKETAEGLQESYGEGSGIFIVNQRKDDQSKSDRTAEEIKAAVNEGKTVLLRAAVSGELYSLCVNLGPNLIFTNVKPGLPGNLQGQGLTVRTAIMTEGDGIKFTNPTRGTLTPNPCKLKLTGAVEAEYDGSEEIVVEIPQGGSGVSAPAVCLCNMQAVHNLSTDEYTFSGMDKTYAEMYAVYSNGGLLWVRLAVADAVTGNQAFTHECALLMLMNDGEMKGLIFGPTSGQELSVIIVENGDVMIVPQKMV